jgi:hypothetical protein
MLTAQLLSTQPHRLIHELIAIEVWREKVYPELVKVDFVEKSTMTAYMVLYHEATVISLLEAILYHKESVEACEDSVLDLADYCFRRIVHLNGLPPYNEADDVIPDVREMLDATGQEQLEDQTKTIPFNISTKAVSIMRYIVDNCSVLPLSCLTRLLNTNDLPCAMVPLITDSPWSRTKEGKLQKYVDGEWVEVPPGDRFSLSKAEGQVWLALYTLIQDNECRRKYQWTTSNKNEILRLRGHFNDVLVDQIPILNDLRRTIEELSLMEPEAPEASVVLEQVPEIQTHLMKTNTGKWTKIAEYQKRKVFCPSEKVMKEQAMRLAETYDMDMLESILPDDPKCAAGTCGEPATLRCSKCKCTWYCRRQCQVEDWKKHKPMCKMMCAASNDVEKAVAAGVGEGGGRVEDSEPKIVEEEEEEEDDE